MNEQRLYKEPVYLMTQCKGPIHLSLIPSTLHAFPAPSLFTENRFHKDLDHSSEHTWDETLHNPVILRFPKS